MKIICPLSLGLAVAGLLTVAHSQEHGDTNYFINPPSSGSDSKPESYSVNDSIPIKFSTDWEYVRVGIHQGFGGDPRIPLSSIHFDPSSFGPSTGIPLFSSDWSFYLDSSNLQPPIHFNLSSGRGKNGALIVSQKLSADFRPVFTFVVKHDNGDPMSNMFWSQRVLIEDKKSGLSQQAEIGLGVGIGLGLGSVLLGLGMFFWFRRRKHRHQQANSDETGISNAQIYERTGDLQYVEQHATSKRG